jgi:hypothetical protein
VIEPRNKTMEDNNDKQVAQEYILAFSRPNPSNVERLERTGYEIYESDGGAFFAVKKDAPDLAHALASSAAQGDGDAIDAIYADTDAEVESEYRMKYGAKASGNSSAIASAAKLK